MEKEIGWKRRSPNPTFTAGKTPFREVYARGVAGKSDGRKAIGGPCRFVRQPWLTFLFTQKIRADDPNNARKKGTEKEGGKTPWAGGDVGSKYHSN